MLYLVIIIPIIEVFLFCSLIYFKDTKDSTLDFKILFPALMLSVLHFLHILSICILFYLYYCDLYFLISYYVFNVIVTFILVMFKVANGDTEFKESLAFDLEFDSSLFIFMCVYITTCCLWWPIYKLGVIYEWTSNHR